MRVIHSCLSMMLALFSLHAAAQEPIRQRRTVVVDGVREEWTLKWSGPVRPVCAASDLTDAPTCPCNGFAYGEQGRLFLERKRSGAPVERLALSGLFKGMESPADDGNAALARLPRMPSDPTDDIGDDGALRRFRADLAKRAPVDVMAVKDFARDGLAATFLLQVGTVPCGKREMVLVGVTRREPRLHVVSSVAHPERPLVLQRSAWMAALANGGEARVVDLPCGDHGSENEVEQAIRIRDGRFFVRSTTYDCRDDGSRGAPVSSEDG